MTPLLNAISTLPGAHKVAAGIAVATLATSAAVGAFAAQDRLPGQSQDASPNVAASATAHSGAPEAGGTPRATKGIPTSNSHFTPADSDAVCDRGEAAVKTTPAGTQVEVPCQAIEQGGNGQGHADATPADASGTNTDRTPGAGNAPVSLPTAAADAGSDGDHRAEPTIPPHPPEQ